jgi:hypothetical protein
MSEFMPHYAPVVVLLFLGTVLLIGPVFSYCSTAPSAALRSSQGSVRARHLRLPLDISSF